MIKKHVRLIIIVSLLVGVFLAWKFYTTYFEGKIILNVVPSIAHLSINEADAGKTRSFNLKPQTYRLKVYSEGFEAQSFSINVSPHHTENQTIALKALTGQAIKYYLDHPQEAAIAEGVEGSKLNQTTDKAQVSAPILAVLPYFRRDWRIDYGKSRLHPDNPAAAALYITTINEAAKQEALDWMRSQGFDPAEYEIIYN